MIERASVPTSVIEGLSKIDTACIGDVVAGVGLRGIALGILPLDPKMRICGQAVTLRQISSRDRRNRARHETVLLEMCKPGDILVIDQGGRMDGAPWGSNVTREALNRGLGGTVIDGATRDGDDIVRLGYPTFSRGVTIPHTHGLFYTTCLNDYPVQIGEAPLQIMVAPGDVVVGDTQGVVVVPGNRAAEILELAQRRHGLDLRFAEIVSGGRGRGSDEAHALIAEIRALEGIEEAAGHKW